MNAPANITFEDEARQLAEDEHHTHTLRIEEMRMDCEYSERDVFGYEQDYGYCEDFDAFYLKHRTSFLEAAREQFSEVAA